MSDERYEVRIENVFEGPMDLLVYLIKKNEVDIYDIPISLITDQYLAYIDWMKAMNVDLAGEFIYMAATLTQIKSRMLLPRHDDAPEDEEDPRLEIVRPLSEYMRMKSAAEMLASRPLLGEDIFSRPKTRDGFEVDRSAQPIRVGLFELIDAFQQILSRVGQAHQVDFSAERFSLQDKIAQLIEILEEKGSVTFQELFQDQADREELITAFLAVLELARLNLIRVAQYAQNGIIRLFYQ